MIRLLFITTVWLSCFFNPVRGSAEVKTKQHAICSDFSISANEYVDTGLSLRDISTDRRKISASKLQDAVTDAARDMATDPKKKKTNYYVKQIKEYAGSLILFVIPGVIVLIFSVLGLFPIFIARCCCPTKCCRPKKPVPAPKGDEALPDKERQGYSRAEKACPVIVYAILSLVILALVVVGITSSGTILQGMTDTMCSLEILVGDLDIFMTDLAGAIRNVSDHGIGLLDKVATEVERTSDLQVKADETVGNMSLLIRWLSNQTYDGVKPIFDADAMARSEAAILSAKGSAMGQLEESRVMVIDKLVGPRAFISSILGMVTMATNSTAKMLAQANYFLQERPIEMTQIPFLLTESSYKGLMGVLAELRGSNLVVGAAFFSLVVVTIPVSIVGIFVMKCKGKCANCCGLFITRSSCAFLFMAITLVAILGLVLLPLSIVFSDVCILMDTLPKDVRLYAEPFLAKDIAGASADASPDGSAAPAAESGALVDLSMETGLRVVDACWKDESLVDALNLTNTISSFVKKVDFSALDDLSLDPDAMFKEFYDFKAQVAALTPDKFVNMSTIEALERVCNKCEGFDDLPEEYAEGVTSSPGGAKVSLSDYCDGKCVDLRTYPPSGVAGAPTGEIYKDCRTIQSESCKVAKQLREAYDRVVQRIAEASTRFEAQAALVKALGDHISSLHAKLNSARDEFTPFAASVTGIGKYSSCYFVVEFFERTRNAVCGSPSTLSGMLWFATSLAIVPVLSIGLIVTTMFINCRLGGIGQKNHDHIKDIKIQTKKSIVRMKTNISDRIQYLNKGNTEYGGGGGGRRHPVPANKVAPVPRTQQQNFIL